MCQHCGLGLPGWLLYWSQLRSYVHLWTTDKLPPVDCFFSPLKQLGHLEKMSLIIQVTSLTPSPSGTHKILKSSKKGQAPMYKPFQTPASITFLMSSWIKQVTRLARSLQEVLPTGMDKRRKTSYSTFSIHQSSFICWLVGFFQ